MSRPPVPARLELAALTQARDEAEAAHVEAVERLELEGPDRSRANRRECARLYDVLAAAQRRLDAHTGRVKR